jgi:hypothetical protein
LVREGQLAALPLPRKPIADPVDDTVTHTFQPRSDRIDITTRVGDQVFATIVQYAFGSGDRGLTLVGDDQAGQAHEYRLSHYTTAIGWDVTSGQPVDGDITPEQFAGKLLGPDGFRRCFSCHATSAHAVVNHSGPEADDRAIGCERCHGPGASHVTLITSKQGSVAHDADLAIARPTMASAPEIVKLCAGCHSPTEKGGITLTPGAADSIRFQGVTLPWSRCYTESGQMLSCVTCHSPHRDAETKHEVYEARCLDCHSSRRTLPPQTAANPSRASKTAGSICPVEPRHNCIECHMPKLTTIMSHTLFTDHFIRVHRADERTEKLTSRQTR